MSKSMTIFDEYQSATQKYNTERILEEKYSVYGNSRTYESLFNGYPLTANMVVFNLRDNDRSGKIIAHFFNYTGEESRELKLRLINLDETVKQFIIYLQEFSTKQTKEALEKSLCINGFEEDLKKFLAFIICEEKYSDGTLLSPESNRTMFYLDLFRELRSEVYHSTMKANKYYNITLDAERSYEILSDNVMKTIRGIKAMTNTRIFDKEMRRELKQ